MHTNPLITRRLNRRINKTLPRLTHLPHHRRIAARLVRAPKAVEPAALRGCTLVRVVAGAVADGSRGDRADQSPPDSRVEFIPCLEGWPAGVVGCAAATWFRLGLGVACCCGEEG